MLNKVCGSAVFGVDAYTITAEVNVDNGIGYHLVGLPYNPVIKRALYSYLTKQFFVGCQHESRSKWLFLDPSSAVSAFKGEIQRYMGKISVPLLDRIDMHLEVSAIPFEKLMQKRHGESSLLVESV